MTPVERARRAVREILHSYRDARDVTEREDVARLIALLAPNGGRSLADLAEQAMATSTAQVPR